MRISVLPFYIRNLLGIESSQELINQLEVSTLEGQVQRG